MNTIKYDTQSCAQEFGFINMFPIPAKFFQILFIFKITLKFFMHYLGMILFNKIIIGFRINERIIVVDLKKVANATETYANCIIWRKFWNWTFDFYSFWYFWLVTFRNILTRRNYRKGTWANLSLLANVNSMAKQSLGFLNFNSLYSVW